MKGPELSFAIGLVKPVKGLVVKRIIKATDRAWREAIFGLGGSKKRIGGVRLGTIDGQPLALIAELQTEARSNSPIWTFQAKGGVLAFMGPAAVYNDAGFGPASLGISIDRLKELVDFLPDPVTLPDGLRRTLDMRRDHAGPV